MLSRWFFFCFVVFFPVNRFKLPFPHLIISNWNYFPYSTFISHCCPKIDLITGFFYPFNTFFRILMGPFLLLPPTFADTSFGRVDFQFGFYMCMCMCMCLGICERLCLFWLPLHTVLNRNKFWSSASCILWIFGLDLLFGFDLPSRQFFVEKIKRKRKHCQPRTII